MTPLRFSMLTATLLAFAATVHGQAPPPEPTCPCSGLAGWLTPYLQQSMQTWQRVRTLTTGQMCDKGECGSVGTPGCCKLGSCVTGATGCVKCCETVQAPASCCCAKACASCESCKAKKDAAALQGAVFPPPPCLAGLLHCPDEFNAMLKKVQETRCASVLLGAGVNGDDNFGRDIVLNFDISAAQQADRLVKLAEFYARTGHPGAAQFYHELLMRRHGIMLPTTPMPVPHQMVQVQAMPMPPMNFGFQSAPCTSPVTMALPFNCPIAPPMPVPPPPPMARQVVQVHAIPASPMCMPPTCTLTPGLNVPCCNGGSVVIPPPSAVIQVPECVAAAPTVKHAHLVTPDLEAHAVRMTHRGDTIILEGDVILVDKKHAKPIRIEAERAIINMKDGSVSVEGSSTISNFGVTHTSAVAPVVERVHVEERCVHLLRLRNVPADDVVRLLAVQIARGTCLGEIRLEADPKSNMIRVEGTTRNVELIGKMAAELDRALSNRIEITVVPVNLSTTPPIPR